MEPLKLLQRMEDARILLRVWGMLSERENDNVRRRLDQRYAKLTGPAGAPRKRGEARGQ